MTLPGFAIAVIESGPRQVRNRTRNPCRVAWVASRIDGRSGLEPVLADLVEELPAADAEAFGGPGAVAAAGARARWIARRSTSASRARRGTSRRRPRRSRRGGRGRRRRARRRRGARAGWRGPARRSRRGPGRSRAGGRCPARVIDSTFASASGDSDRSAQPYLRSRRRRICSARGGMSSGRSRRGGIAIRTTFRR